LNFDFQAVLSGDRLALSRLLTQIENQTPEGQQALAQLFPHTGQAHLIGVTGAPGTGKSSLVNQLAHYYRHPQDGAPPKTVAVVAVDPSSPFSGGAVLGDRVRMTSLSGDPGVFIRSMASRGSLGGLARATSALVQVFDAAGFQVILIETVGAGQAEVDIARLAHTTLVVEAPDLGDDIQAIKAGILEIADILVINKADRPGVENAERTLRGMLELAHPARQVFLHYGKVESSISLETEQAPWQPPIQRTIATAGAGIPELVKLIASHRRYLEETGDLRQRERSRLATELDQRLQSVLVERFLDSVADGEYQNVLDRVVKRSLSPSQAVKLLIDGEET
jgi:LAO/AO transport system kinase